MSIKKKLYGVLVSRKAPIRKQYTEYKKSGASMLKRGLYLFKLNFSYYILRNKNLYGFGKTNTKPYSKAAESSLSFGEPPEALAEKLSGFDAVSFDIFDTLIYRPFAAPVDLFHIAGAKAELLDFAETREHFERLAREKKYAAEGTYEVNIDEIYSLMSEYGSSFRKAEKYESEAELELCFANPYMKKVWDILKSRNVPLVIISDMYLKRDLLEKLLAKNGYDGYRKLFVSNEEGVSKYDGGLYRAVKEYLGCTSIAHVGDNKQSDIEMSRRNGFTPFYLPAPNVVGAPYRPEKMSRIIGSAYAGIVNAKFHNGTENLPMLYEYGYAYSGIFALGYCVYIRRLQIMTGADKVLFLARDGDLLKKIYNKLYPESGTEYFLWSRLAAVKLCFEENMLDFIRRFVYHKSSGGYKSSQIFSDMGLEKLFPDFKQGDIKITSENFRLVEDYITANKDKIKEIYSPLDIGAKKYFSEKLRGSKKALAVDVGWAGSGFASISELAEKWGFDTDIIGVVAGTNDSFSEQPDASEALIQSGKLYSYCFSQRHNRHIYSVHDAVKGHNIFFEMLLGSESASLSGFDENGDPVFSQPENGNAETVKLIHSGALDFVNDYTSRFEKYPFMFDISGSDAYAPFLLAAEKGRDYFEKVLGDCCYNADVCAGNAVKLSAQIK